MHENLHSFFSGMNAAYYDIRDWIEDREAEGDLTTHEGPWYLLLTYLNEQLETTSERGGELIKLPDGATEVDSTEEL